ncbi:MAG: hypothetical protein RLZ98_1143 [Pseudomonadota bacterium]|jgi:hypothetical protein
MARSDQLYPGERLKQFFRNLLADEPEISAPLRERLVEKFSRPINLMRVWAYPEPPAAGHTYEAEDLQAAGAAEALAEMAPWPEPDADNGAPSATPQPPFNPFAFNAIVVFKREGREALMAQLETISSAENLRRLADAQHLAVPRGLDAPADLRLAILKGAEQRLADRRAAGS